MSQQNADIKSLLMTVLALDSLEEAETFFRDLLTESEITEFTQRWKAAQMLEKKVSYNQIVKETGLSSTTVARISKWLQGNGGGYRTAIRKLGHN